jgi:S1-C subfamily serine protease
MYLIVLLFGLAGPQVTDNTLEKIERDIAAVVERTRPSVVQIVARFGDEEFQKRVAPPREIYSSGFVISADGFILADLGGIEPSKSIEVRLHDGRRLEAELRGFDRVSAVALLRVRVEGLTPVEFADADSVRQGSIAVLVSNPAGLLQSSSVGFVSGLHRSIAVGGRRYDDMLQTTVPIQSGDGGGLIANARGRVVGMVHSRYRPDGLEVDPAGFVRPVPRSDNDFLPASGPSIGFATPASTLRFVADRLMKHGEVKRGWAGLGLRRIGDRTEVVEVVPGGPAEKAGVRPGDLVLEFDGSSPADLAALRRRVVEAELPKILRVRVQRGTASQEFDIALAVERAP